MIAYTQTAELHDVTIDVDGTITINCAPEYAARLAGRTHFGSVDLAQAELADAIAEAWYAADCPD